MNRMVTCLWFDSNAEEAANFYVSVFKSSKLGSIVRYGKEGFEVHGRPAGSVLTIEFQLNGQDFVGLNGGPVFTFNEAVSFQVICTSQDEVDHYWNALGEGGPAQAKQCGWLKDKFGVSWQIVPEVLLKLLGDPDTAKSGRAMQAMLKMKKLDIAALEKAAKG